MATVAYKPVDKCKYRQLIEHFDRDTIFLSTIYPDVRLGECTSCQTACKFYSREADIDALALQLEAVRAGVGIDPEIYSRPNSRHPAKRSQFTKSSSTNITETKTGRLVPTLRRQRVSLDLLSGTTASACLTPRESHDYGSCFVKELTETGVDPANLRVLFKRIAG